MGFRWAQREEVAGVVIAVVAVAVGALIWARGSIGDPPPGPASSAPKLDAPMPVDSRLITGKLKNQFRYFVRANDSPEGRAELRLVVNAGSVLETRDQRGLAHAVEHMLFRGTKRFPGRTLDDYLESIGMRPGSDVNATTSEDETIYRITVPTSRAGALDTALAILADMAHAASFDPIQARTEAGVVMSEWRSRSDAGQRLHDARNLLLFGESQYADHTTIGDTAVLRRFDIGAMRRFYDDWYRPDLMAIVAVGDFDASHVELTIRKEFAGIAAPRSPREHPEFRVPLARDPRGAVLSDPEAAASRVAIWRPKTPRPWRKVDDYRRMLIDELWYGVLSDRLDDAADRPGSPILSGDASEWSLTRTLEADVVTAEAADGRETDALKMLSGEVARLAKYGVTTGDVEHRKTALLRERRNAEEWDDPSSALADGYAEEFLTGDVRVGHTAAYELTRDLLPTIGASDVAARARAVALDSGSLIVITQPVGARSVGSATELVAVARAAAERVDAPPNDTADLVPLVRTPPQPGSIATEQNAREARAFDWTLSNGMRVILKPTRFAFDQIELHVFGPGGASLSTDAGYPSALLSDGVIRSTGLGPLNGRALSRRLDRTSADLSPSVTDAGVELRGSAAPRDLELVFQLLYLYFTDVRSDSVAFRRYVERAAAFARRRHADPDEIFDDSVSAIWAQHGPRSLTGSERFVAGVKLVDALAFWRARTSNATNFTLVMTGDFTLDRVRPLIAKYLASLPAGTHETARDAGVAPPRGIVRREFVAGRGPKARTQIRISGSYDGTSEANDAIETVSDLTERALSNRLREQLGGTYGVTASASYTLAMPQRYIYTIDFEAAPERIDSLAAAALAEINRLRTAGPSESELQKVREAKVRDLDGALNRNRHWMTELAWHARMGWPLGTITKHQDDARSLAMSTARAACKTYLRTDEYVEVTMRPESAKTKSP